VITIEDNLDQLNAALGEYMRHTKLNLDDALIKQGTKIAFAISQRMAMEKPGKGSIRAERLAALKAGEGVRVRESLRTGKTPKAKSRLNRQARLVKKELALRERGRGFLSYATRLNAGKLRSAKHVKKVGRYNQRLAEAGLQIVPDGGSIKVVYGSARSEIGGTLNRPKYRRHINDALAEVTDDILLYVDRKQEALN
jgi:hypothetical protein